MLYRLAAYIPDSQAIPFLVSQFGLDDETVRCELDKCRAEPNVGAIFRKWRDQAGQNATTKELERLLNESENCFINIRLFRTIRQTLQG